MKPSLFLSLLVTAGIFGSLSLFGSDEQTLQQQQEYLASPRVRPLIHEGDFRAFNANPFTFSEDPSLKNSVKPTVINMRGPSLMLCGKSVPVKVGPAGALFKIDEKTSKLLGSTGASQVFAKISDIQEACS